MNRLARLSPRPSLNGFTLVELLITIAIVAVLGSLAVPSFRSLAANQALSGAISDLMAATLQARTVALKENRRVIIQPLDSTWNTGWRVYVDMDQDAVFTSGTDREVIRHEPLQTDIAIVALSGSDEARSASLFGYGGDGFLATIDGNSAGSVSMKSTYTGRQKYLVVSRTGRARTCDPTSSPGCAPS